MALWALFVFCAAATSYGLWSINRDLGRGRVQGRGFGFDRDTQPLGYYSLMTFNCVATGVLIIVTAFLTVSLLRRLHAL
jgi:hypothetical protein